MPELPEVEVTRRTLEPLLIGRRVAKIVTTRRSYFFLTPPRELARRLEGRRFVALERHGKYLVATLDDASRLLLHLGMTGQLFSSAAVSPRLLSAKARATLAPGQQRSFRPDAHTHLAIAFDDAGPDVLFRDVRKFGKVRWLAPDASDARLDKLGPDALGATGAAIREAARRRKRSAVKTLLLDQSVLAGVGNIYADEALFLAKIRPTRRAHALSASECDALARAVTRVLRRGIAAGGSSIDDFVRPDGRDGGYQDQRKVYGRSGEPCPRCGTPIRHRVIGQRSTHFCPECQR